MARSLSRRHTEEEEEEESVFVSMTDMTVSFLFIVMILLAFFASQFDDEETVPKNDFDQVQIALEALQVEFDALRAENSGLKTDNKALREERDTLRLALRDMREDLTRLQAENEELLIEVSRLSELLKNPLETYVANVDAERRRLLEELRDTIIAAFPDLTVVVTSEGDVLRFQGEALFRSGGAILLPNARERIQFIADRLDSILPCYTIGSLANFDASCNPAFAIIEAVQIEGHADRSGDYEFNMKLSANRAVATHSTMTAHKPSLTKHLNYESEPILAVAGYGPNRPIDRENLAPNRRIDLRFIMVTPTKNSEIENIRERLREGSATEPPR